MLASAHSETPGSLGGKFSATYKSLNRHNAFVYCPCHDRGNHMFDCEVTADGHLSCSFTSNCTNNCTGTYYCVLEYDVHRWSNISITAAITSSRCQKWNPNDGVRRTICNSTAISNNLTGSQFCTCETHYCSRKVFLRRPPDPPPQKDAQRMSDSENCLFVGVYGASEYWDL